MYLEVGKQYYCYHNINVEQIVNVFFIEEEFKMAYCPVCHESGTVSEIGNGRFRCVMCGDFYDRRWSAPSTPSRSSWSSDSSVSSWSSSPSYTCDVPRSAVKSKIPEIYAQAEKKAKAKKHSSFWNVVCWIVFILILMSIFGH